MSATCFKWTQGPALTKGLPNLRIVAQAYRDCVATVARGIEQEQNNLADDPGQAVEKMREYNLALVGINSLAFAIEQLAGLAPGELRGVK